MKRKLKRFAVALYAVLLLLAAFPTTALAYGSGSYHAPCITLLVYHAPEDLEASIEMEKNEERFPVTMQKETRLWETQFRLYREGAYRMKTWFGNEKDFKNAVLRLRTGGRELSLPIPAEKLTPGGKEDVLSYDFKTGELTVGMPDGRMALFFAMRMVMLLLVMAVILYLFGYRNLRSWLGFLVVNLVTMGVVNLIIKDWLNANTDMYSLFFLGMLLVLLAELVGMLVVLNEYDRNRAMRYAVTASVAAAGVFYVILTYFPI